MKNSKHWYIVVTFIAGLLVTFSILMPGFLLSKTEDSIMGYPYIVSEGVSSSQQPGSNPISTLSTPTVQSLKDPTTHIQLFEQGADGSTLSTGNISGSMDIKQATQVCIDQLTALLKKGALPQLEGFPGSYSVNAELRTITDKNDKPTLQYWNINFTSSDDKSIPLAKMSVSVDAQTGIFFSIDVSVFAPNKMKMDAGNSIEAIALLVHLPGRILSLDQRSSGQRVTWGVNNSSLLLEGFLWQKPPHTFFSMRVTTN